MGEIGLPLMQYQYSLTYCELVLIERGYARRLRHLWSATRWQTHYIMAAQVGSDNLRKSGITCPQDLIKFPWEHNKVAGVSDDDLKQLLKEMDAINASRKRKDSE